ncbi:hypothetical protein [Bradyrhizobium stylosanthis]|uniref:Uncharacterized protein n=1 Tax=Bradyrhizobium stylosanthis TaxID=1803665 RepID=A0A560CXM5_9BRAD|nr:hypothetical protein [Bradyrhizobium stylosanthis]TWA89586.1 hypothetical protein FBZ96_11954 [Bradyrhizobium stylosanthis]
MPDTLANPYAYQSPIGAALKNLSGVLTKKSTEATDIAHLETALALKQKRENTAALGDALRALGTAQFDRRAAIDNAVRAGVSPEAVGGFERYNSANQYGAADPRTTNAFVGAGGSYGSTAAGEREQIAAANQRNAAAIAEQGRQFDSKPTTINTPTGPQIVRQSEAYGQPAVEDIGKVKGAVARNAYASPAGLAGADDATKQFIGVDSKATPTPHNYVSNGQNFITYDGTTDANSGKPLPPGGYMANAVGPAEAVGLPAPVRNDLAKQDVSNQRFRGLLNYTKELAKQDPNNFGITGLVKGTVQDTAAAADNIARGLGYSGIQDGLANARTRAVASGVNPSVISGVFDPKLPALHSAADLMVFSAAEALAGQSGRSVTDKDVKIIKNIVGDPTEWSANQQKFLSKLDTVGQILDLQQQVIDNNLRRGSPAAPPAAPGAASPPTSPAPGAQPAAQPDPLAQARDAIARGAPRDAVIQRLQQSGVDPAGL